MTLFVGLLEGPLLLCARAAGVGQARTDSGTVTGNAVLCAKSSCS